MNLNQNTDQNHNKTNTKERTIIINKHTEARPQHNNKTAEHNTENGTHTNHRNHTRTTNEHKTMTNHHTHTKNINHNIENTGRTDHHSITETAPDTIATSRAQPTTDSVFATPPRPAEGYRSATVLTTLTPIQQKPFRPVSPVADLLASSQTGSGKPAFLPYHAPHHQQPAPKKVTGRITARTRALILTRTRELAAQICHTSMIWLSTDLSCAPVFGGVSMLPQESLSEAADIMVARPGRLLDHFNQTYGKPGTRISRSRRS
ncbi:hypothetical protein MASR1M12_35280 [Erysipelotrichia bacterium]